MASTRWLLLLVLLALLLSEEFAAVAAQGKGNGKDDGNGNGKGDGKGNGDGNGNDNGNGNGDGNGNGKGDGNGDGNGNGKGDGNGDGKGNGNGSGDGKGNGNGNGDGNGNGNGNGDGKGNGNGNGDAAQDYITLTPDTETGQERAMCLGTGRCHLKTLKCPQQCAERKPNPKQNKKVKGCFISCVTCETICKHRMPNCDGYGSICYDPRLVGGDGVMFYFHGHAGRDYALVSDDRVQINAHLIGIKPKGRTRDFTWVQALSIIFDNHTLVIAANKVSKWDDAVDSLTVEWDGKEVVVPIDGEAERRSDNGKRKVVVVERTAEVNSVRVSVTGLAEINVRVRPIGEKENRVHNYRLPEDDAFAHLESQFKFAKLSDDVEGVLGQTYRPGYVSPVKRGVAMPMMGGEERYRTPSLRSPQCALCRFQQRRQQLSTVTAAPAIAQY